MDTLQQLASTKFVLKFLENSKITLSKAQHGSKISFDPPKSSVILHARDPIWMFAALDDSLEQICLELNQWASYNVLHLVFPDDNEPTLRLGDFVWNNLLIDYEKTALNLSDNENLLLDDRLVLSVIYGLFNKAEQICKQNQMSKFKYENEISMYRRLALGYISPSDVMSTVKSRIRFPLNFLLKVSVENLLRLNFIDVARRLIAEYSLNPTVEGRNHLTSFFTDSGRIIPEIVPALISALIPQMLNDRHRCETMFRFAVGICGEEPLKLVVDKWPGTTVFRDIDGLYLAVVRHPLLVENLIKLLESNNFNINWQTLITLTRQNDYVFREILKTAPVEKMWQLLTDNDYELFYNICESNARKSLLWIKDNVTKERYESLIKSRNYSCFLAACKRGNFLVVKIMSDTLDKNFWDDLFSFQNYEAFYLVTKGGFIAIVEWFGMLCTKYNMSRKYQEAHMITVKMLEIEAKMLEAALDALRCKNQPTNE